MSDCNQTQRIDVRFVHAVDDGIVDTLGRWWRDVLPADRQSESITATASLYGCTDARGTCSGTESNRLNHPIVEQLGVGRSAEHVQRSAAVRNAGDESTS